MYLQLKRQMLCIQKQRFQCEPQFSALTNYLPNSPAGVRKSRAAHMQATLTHQLIIGN